MMKPLLERKKALKAEVEHVEQFQIHHLLKSWKCLFSHALDVEYCLSQT